MKRNYAFTMIELLTVIAIIAILAAILFPVYSRVKDSAYRSSDMSNMNSIRTALQLYKTDQGAYPPQLLGYVSFYSGGGPVVPANLVVGALYSKRIDSVDTFRPSYLRGADQAMTAVTTPGAETAGVVWPTVQPGNYAGITPAACAGAINPQCALQAFQPSDGFVSTDPANNNALGVTGTPVDYYAISGYDTALVKVPTTVNAAGQERELRYTLFWSSYGLGSGSAADATNQLGYTEPPETTVITWDSYFRDYASDNSPAPGEKREIVLFLGGAARPFDSTIVYRNAWQTGP